MPSSIAFCSWIGLLPFLEDGSKQLTTSCGLMKEVNRRLRDEQDAEYQRSLEADRERERKRTADRAEEEARQLAAQQAEDAERCALTCSKLVARMLN